MYLSLSFSVAHTAVISHQMAFPWDLGNFESAEREALKNLTSYWAFLQFCHSLYPHIRISETICAKNACMIHFIPRTCFKANDVLKVHADFHLCLVFLPVLVVAFYFITVFTFLSHIRSGFCKTKHPRKFSSLLVQPLSFIDELMSS